MECIQTSLACKEKDFEIVGVKITEINTVILCICRSQLGNVDTFLNKLEDTLTKLNGLHPEKVMIAGDFNINFITNSITKIRLIDLLPSFDMNHQDA